MAHPDDFLSPEEELLYSFKSGEEKLKLSYREIESFISTLSNALANEAENDAMENKISTLTHKYLIVSKLLESILYSDYETRAKLYDSINFNGAYRHTSEAHEPSENDIKDYEDFIKYLYDIDFEKYKEIDIREEAMVPRFRKCLEALRKGERHHEYYTEIPFSSGDK